MSSKITKIITDYSKNIIFEKKEDFNIKKNKESIENKVLNIYPDIIDQNILGFGGSLTQASAELINDEILREYFQKENSNYSLCRIPIGSCDFSSNSYSYSYKKDLSDFNISEDKKYIIPEIKEIININSNIKFLASPWSPPSFTKTNHSLFLGGKLQKKYYNLYAIYLTKYLLSYKEEGINIDYMTIQNEPNAKQIWESCLFTPEEEITFVKDYLQPLLNKNNIDTKILIWDHNKEKLVSRTNKEIDIYQDFEGIAFHWYTGDHFENIKILHELYPNKLLIHTEGCNAYSWDNEIQDAEHYAHDIIGDFNSGTNGYIDWNLLLDNKGGPNHVKNYCNSPIMLDKEGKYKKRLMYYYIKHFSKFVNPNAISIGHSRYTDNIEMTAFQNEDESIIVILLNKKEEKIQYNLVCENEVIEDTIPAHSIITYKIC